MELDELLRKEGLGEAELRDTLSWARQRAEEIVSGLVADAELGPLLDDDFTSPPLPHIESPDAPLAVGVGGQAPADERPLANGAAAPQSDEDSDLGEPSGAAAPPSYASSRAADAPDPIRRRSTEPTPVGASPGHVEPGQTERRPVDGAPGDPALGLPPPPVRPDLPEVGPGVEAGPMADAAYDQGSVAAPMPEPGPPGMEPGVPALPALGGERDEVTQPRGVPPTDPNAAQPATHTDAIEIDDEEIELLDDDDLELVDDDDDDEAEARAHAPDVPPLAPIAAEGGVGGGEVPEWQAALNSAAMGGGAQADQDSGLYRMPQPAAPRAAAPTEPTPEPVAEDESMDIDIGDL